MTDIPAFHFIYTNRDVIFHTHHAVIALHILQPKIVLSYIRCFRRRTHVKAQLNLYSFLRLLKQNFHVNVMLLRNHTQNNNFRGFYLLPDADNIHGCIDKRIVLRAYNKTIIMQSRSFFFFLTHSFFLLSCSMHVVSKFTTL